MSERYLNPAAPNGQAYAPPPYNPQMDPGAFMPHQARPSGFDASTIWDGAYNLNPYVDAQGVIPPPTQERIDRFRRSGAEFAVEAERLAREADEAQRKADAERRKAAQGAAAKGEEYVEPFSAEEAMKEADTALSEEKRLYDLMRDNVAEFCRNKPTRNQLGKLPDPVFRRFVDHIGSLINPEV